MNQMTLPRFNRTKRQPPTASSSNASVRLSFNPTKINRQTSVANFIEHMKIHVREVTEATYRDLKSPFHNPGEKYKRDLKLDEIFTNLIVYKGRAMYDFSGDRVEQLKEYAKPKENLLPAVPGDIFDSKERKILVVGRPGIGKTMFSTKILRNWACNSLLNEAQKLEMDFRVAFLIKLRMFNSTNKKLNLRELLDHSEYSTSLSKKVWNYIRQNPKRVLVILDGFDEYSGRTEINKDDVSYRNNEEDRMPVHFLVKKIVSGQILTGATVVMTTRPNAVSCIKSPDFDKTVEILGFNTEQVKDYVQKFTKQLDKAETIKHHITSNLNLLAFCYIPVNCFIICSCLLELLVDTSLTSLHHLPTRLTEIYSIAIKMFYFSYDDDQYRHNKTEGQTFFLKPFKELPSSVQNVFTRLGKIAFDGIKEGRLVFESHEVKDLKGNGLFHRLPDTKAHPFAERRAQYCFLHLTVQEFLAAKYLVDTLSSKELQNFVSDHIQEGAWKVVMQFVAGLLYDREGQSTDIFSNLLPLKTVTEEFHNELGEDPEERTETLTWWPGSVEDKDLVLALFNCMFENKTSSQEVQKKLGQIGCNALDFMSCELVPLDVLSLSHALKSVKGILDFDLYNNRLHSLGCLEIAKLLCGNEHDRSFCELKRLNLSCNLIPDKGVEHLTTVLTHINCKLNTLNLAGNRITNKGVKHLTTALTNSNCKHMRRLNLASNETTNEGLRQLTSALAVTNCRLKYY